MKLTEVKMLQIVVLRKSWWSSNIYNYSAVSPEGSNSSGSRSNLGSHLHFGGSSHNSSRSMDIEDSVTERIENG